MLSINNLHVFVADKPILKGLTLVGPFGEAHAMRPNGVARTGSCYADHRRPS